MFFTLEQHLYSCISLSISSIYPIIKNHTYVVLNTYMLHTKVFFYIKTDGCSSFGAFEPWKVDLKVADPERTSWPNPFTRNKSLGTFFFFLRGGVGELWVFCFSSKGFFFLRFFFLFFLGTLGDLSGRSNPVLPK